jgi:endoribonuclease Dicer
VIEYYLVKYIYITSPSYQKAGILIRKKSKSVDAVALNRISVSLGLQNLLQHRVVGWKSEINVYVRNVDAGWIETSNGRDRKQLGDMVESVSGALLLDSKLDLDKVWLILWPWFSQHMLP